MVEDLGVVQQAVKDRDGLDFVAEQLGPVGHPPVGGDDHRGAGVAAVDQLEEPVRVAVLQSEIADFVDDQNVRALVVRELVPQRAELIGLPEFADDVVEGCSGRGSRRGSASIANPTAKWVFPTPGGPRISEDTLF